MGTDVQQFPHVKKTSRTGTLVNLTFITTHHSPFPQVLQRSVRGDGGRSVQLESLVTNRHVGGSYKMVAVHLDEAEVHFGSYSCD